MGVLKNLLCRMIGNRVPQPGTVVTESRIIHDNVRHVVVYRSCLDWTPAASSVIVGLAAFNFHYPGVLARWIRNGRISRKEKRMVMIMLLIVAIGSVVWSYLTCRAEETLRSVFPAAIFFLPYISLLLAVLLLFYSASLRPSFDALCSKVLQFIVGLRYFFYDPYKRTRSGAVYGRRD